MRWERKESLERSCGLPASRCRAGGMEAAAGRGWSRMGDGGREKRRKMDGGWMEGGREGEDGWGKNE